MCKPCEIRTRRQPSTTFCICFDLISFICINSRQMFSLILKRMEHFFEISFRISIESETFPRFAPKNQIIFLKIYNKILFENQLLPCVFRGKSQFSSNIFYIFLTKIICFLRANRGNVSPSIDIRKDFSKKYSIRFKIKENI